MRALAAALLLALAAPAAAAVDSARVDRIAETPGFTGVALIGQGDAIVWSKAIGEAAPGKPNAIYQTWRLASVTKQLTALIAMQEVASGTLDLDQPIRSAWPEWPGPAAVTPRMLLRHSSGLADPAESTPDKDKVPEFYRRTGAAAAPATAAVGYCAAKPRAEPPAAYHYNNCDFIVLGALLEKITGKSFATLLQERIAQPLGLASLGLFAHDAPAAPHVAGSGQGKPEAPLNLGSYGAAGSAYMSPADLWKFDRALMENRLLDKIATRAMWEGDPALGFAALGSWSYPARIAGCPDPVDLIERRGAIGGVQIRNFLAPKLLTAVILFTNSGDFDYGEVGEGSGFAHDMLSAALCPAP